MPDPTSIGLIIMALIGGILIISGGLTAAGRGPGKLIKPKPRRRGATKRARRWRRWIGIGLIAAGLILLVKVLL